ncbi:hypothetical protein CRE_16261 [Caenorhabditis remanei]|uniref:Uncharacterized protein n=1 Tax=Caenorhabditis remanei TaxID=31234 RepID=E3N2K4_CAERE|nr:hypothetical protein CRE_16261 [Caenorhabditis remanei]
MSIRDRKYRWVRRARLLMAIELFLSIIFDFTMIGSVKRGQMLNCLLVVVITLNILTGARLLLKLRGIKCASSIMAYVLWKIVQEVVMVPALVVFSFICVDRYLRSWDNVNHGVQILVIVWTYAIYSLFLILFLAWLARFLWQLQSTHASNTDKNENATQISFIDGFHSEADHHQLLDTTSSRMNGANSNEALELREIPLRETTTTTTNSNRPFIPYDHVVPYLSP